MKPSKIFRFFNPLKLTSMKNKTITISQQVLLFEDSDIIGEQKVHIDPNDGFMLVIHAGNEIPLTMKNWKNLCELALEAIIKAEEVNPKIFSENASCK